MIQVSIIDKLRDKKVESEKVEDLGIKLRRKWEDCFVGHLSSKEKEEIYLHEDNFGSGFLWHVFSFKKRDHQKGKDADTIFEQIEKRECYIFYQDFSWGIMVEDGSLLKSVDFKSEEDVYVVDSEFKWTYVHTHERECGSYYSEI